MKLIFQFIRPHWKLCVITIALLIFDVTGALIVSTLAAQMLNLGTSGAAFELLLDTGLRMALVSVLSCFPQKSVKICGWLFTKNH